VVDHCSLPPPPLGPSGRWDCEVGRRSKGAEGMRGISDVPHRSELMHVLDGLSVVRERRIFSTCVQHLLKNIRLYIASQRSR
jgi:hypothetical protein